jgi:glyoxylase-like metal-dependent hydrolase (beta-lactamase superfamily II)
MLETSRKYQLKQIVNTHRHEEQIGNNAVLQREFSLPVRAHREALPVIRQPQENLRLSLFQRFVWGQPVMAKARRLGNQVETQQYIFRVIPTPGHTRDHICLYEEKQGWLFTGHLLGDIEMPSFYPVEAEWDLLNSLQRIAQLDLSVIYCAHAGRITNPDKLIQKRIEAWKNTLGD